MADNHSECDRKPIFMDAHGHHIFRQFNLDIVQCRHDGSHRRNRAERKRDIDNRHNLSSQHKRNDNPHGNMEYNHSECFGKPIFMDTHDYHLFRQHNQHGL